MDYFITLLYHRHSRFSFRHKKISFGDIINNNLERQVAFWSLLWSLQKSLFSLLDIEAHEKIFEIRFASHKLKKGIFILMINSFLIALTFLSIVPVSQKLLPTWNEKNLRFFCLMIPVTGFLFAGLWVLISFVLGLMKVSEILRGFMMMLSTLILTGGLHMDGLMDSCDAIFSRRERETRLKILSDSHAGSFAVMGCVLALMAKTLLFAEIFSRGSQINFLIPIYSRLGMAMILNNLPFAKPGGLAVLLGTSRARGDNIFFAMIFVILIALNESIIIPVIFILSLIIWSKICLKIFGGITGDLLGAFLEISEILLLAGTVIESCI